MSVLLIGYGNVGKELKKVLGENNIPVNFIVNSKNILDAQGKVIDVKENFKKYINSSSVLFISTPSVGEGESVADYYLQALEQRAKIVTCEKAFIANNWNIVQKFEYQIKYAATVGGNSGMLDAVALHREQITEIKAVVNGTLNYIGDKLAAGSSEDEVYKEVTTKGFAEPGARNFNEVIDAELKDVVYKAAILANHSKLFKEIIKPEDISIQKYSKGLRCAVVLNQKGIKAGFLNSEDSSWFPKGANNVLYINNKKIIEGPGAGGRITAERMLEDFKLLELLKNG